MLYCINFLLNIISLRRNFFKVWSKNTELFELFHFDKLALTKLSDNFVDNEQNVHNAKLQ